MQIFSYEFELDDWKPIPRIALIGWVVFYVLFLLYVFAEHGGFLVIDHVNLVVHEGGHLLFSWLGETLCLWGGTILQWLVPLLLATYFWVQRHPMGFTFCGFFFFENFLYTATYMADARTQDLPLVSVGDGDGNPHDWFNIFSRLGVLQHDTQIAAVVRAAGWVGMVAIVAWFAWKGWESWDSENLEV